MSAIRNATRQRGGARSWPPATFNPRLKMTKPTDSFAQKLVRSSSTDPKPAQLAAMTGHVSWRLAVVSHPVQYR